MGVFLRFDNYRIPAKVRGSQAQMAELVDALGSGPSGGNTVEVRVLFWAPSFPKGMIQQNGVIPISTRRHHRNRCAGDIGKPL